MKSAIVLILSTSLAQAAYIAPNATTTVGALPACAAATKGVRLVVTDALTPVALATVTGGGAVVVSVLCNGSVWIVG